MDIQTVFYSLATVFMLLGIIAMGGLIGLVIYLYIKIKELHQMVAEKLAVIDYIKNHPDMLAKNAAMGLTHSSIRGLRNFFSPADE